MSLSKDNILYRLNPSDPTSIRALIDFHRAQFGGWTMQADGEPAGEDPQPNPTDPQNGNDGAKPEDPPLGPNGEKALQAERDARQALQTELNQLKQGLAKVFGGDDQKKATTDEVMAGLQKQMADMQHDNLVLRVANDTRITDADDIALLRGISSEDAMRKLADRIKPTDGDPQPARRPPRQDPDQGLGGDGVQKPGDAGRAEAQRRFKK